MFPILPPCSLFQPIDEAGCIFPNQKKQLYHIEFSFAADPPTVRPATGTDTRPATGNDARPGTGIDTRPGTENDALPVTPTADAISIKVEEERDGEVVFSTIDMPWTEDKMIFSVPVIVR